MRNFQLPKLYPITDARLSKFSHARQVEEFIEGGASLIQLREKHLAPRAFFADAQNALTIARRRNAKIIINDRVDLALALGADGVHLGQDDLPPEAARQILGEKAIIGFSTHTIAQALDGIKKPVDYIAIGPIFQTSTKENPDEIVNLSGLSEVRAAIGDFPLVAIGGITLENAPEVIKAGADSVAVISDLFKNQTGISAQIKLFVKNIGV